LTQCVSPDDEHDVLETCRELKIKINTWKRIVRHVGHLPRIINWNSRFGIICKRDIGFGHRIP
jgi:hypothetical protein